ncbi:hypothetical protein FJ656_04860 [Schumannella luteola]|uniref:Uncharacterized protein n=1 Tax=Schumannella luteola TaxID=472059 RepID=A0A852Y5W6_9MICO|nr:hypothetical protein [Schumannella luteola]NYG98336.1 hypothetical protein [Schumannella luteola]TPX05761.1 hypothetical protein FJ656_04860 [Schumannella luteola]
MSRSESTSASALDRADHASSDSSPRLLTLADAARLARVQRPVVSMWRLRHATGPTPFPDPVVDGASGLRWDAHEVARWLGDTRHGNNPEALAEVELVGTSRAESAPESASSSAPAPGLVSALIALRAVHEAPLSSVPLDELADLADDLDPHDLFAAQEVLRAGDDLGAAVVRADALVESAFSPAAAIEHHRAATRGLAQSVLSTAVEALVAELAHGILGAAGEAVVSTVSGRSGDLVHAVAAAAPGVAIAPAASDDRELRQRAVAHGVALAHAAAANAAHPALSLLLLAGERPAQADIDELDHAVVGLSAGARLLVLGPAALLADGGLPASAARVRSELLRSGVVRAIVRLGSGVFSRTPQRAMALWLIEGGSSSTPLGDQTTLLADLTVAGLDPAVRHDLVADVVAALGSDLERRAHAFRFSRLARTSRLVARGALVDADAALAPPSAFARSQRELRARQLPAVVAELASRAGVPVDALLEPTPASALPSAERPDRTRTLGALRADGSVSLVSGTRLDSDLDLRAPSGVTVIGPAEVTGAAAVGDRRVDPLRLAAAHPSARRTEPGDVVVVTSPRPAAIVDAVGRAVVQSPARVVRIRAADAGLVPELIAADIAAAGRGAGARSSDPNRWVLRRVAPGQVEGMRAALAPIEAERRSLRERLALLDELGGALAEAVVLDVLRAPPAASDPPAEPPDPASDRTDPTPRPSRQTPGAARQNTRQNRSR